MAQDDVKHILDSLQSPISDLETLLNLLARPLESIGLLQTRFQNHVSEKLPKGSFNIPKHLPVIQRALLQSILPSWDSALRESNVIEIADQFLCPKSPTSQNAIRTALEAYTTILSIPFNTFSIQYLSRLASSYHIQILFDCLFDSNPQNIAAIRWEDCVRTVISVPTKVANFCGHEHSVPGNLRYDAYVAELCSHTEAIVWALSSLGSISEERTQAVSYLLAKLVNIGAFPSTTSFSPSQPSFFAVCLSKVQQHMDSLQYQTVWQQILGSIPSSGVLQSIFVSLFSSTRDFPPLSSSSPTRNIVKSEATLLRVILGDLSPENRDLWDIVLGVSQNRDFGEGKARILACWAAFTAKGCSDLSTVEALLMQVLETWSSPTHVKHSLLSKHHYITTLFLVLLSYSPSSANKLALSPTFISAIGTYIKHLDPAIRRCGMLVAEVVATLAGKKLDFEDWEGHDAERTWARSLRDLIKERDIDAEDTELLLGEEQKPTIRETQASAKAKPSGPASSNNTIYPGDAPEPDSDDESLRGYASEENSDRAPSPTPSALEEIERDPTLNVGVKKAPRPVYLTQLGELVRSTNAGLKSEENDEPDKIEMALNCGEELIRRKRNFGMELEENAVNLVYAFIGLQNSYDLDEFSAKRQGIVTALVACCPRRSAPCLIEEFFKNQYSIDQRFVMLTALALGARELASLPVPPPKVVPSRISFPSKRLPAVMHQKLIAEGPVQALLTDISQGAIEKAKDDATSKAPLSFTRERQLRLQKPAKITVVDNPIVSDPCSEAFYTTSPGYGPPAARFTDVAAEYFICPLINQFWIFFRDEQTREERLSHQSDPLYRYRGSGTGLVLNPIVLAQFISTLAVLAHAGRNAPQWLALIAPDSLELAITLGTRPVSQADDGEDDVDPALKAEWGPATTSRDKEASVLAASLELALVVLDGCLDLDGGKSLGLEHTRLVLSAGEWAGNLLSWLERGLRVAGSGGAQEVRLQRGAAGVVLKVQEISERWGRSMVDMR
ncbi:telomere length regulation protein-domain-containing protein [Thelephora terrestris]|uniref:Telomere length regulation protein-domain-containing protein n=1 Tax=Thelephora terrestris TaxID=56493 RepID=A0A9P6HS92_9AGAM|nr:telomere length regulation protein-domain-containing protein [Thelephora terrestris]